MNVAVATPALQKQVLAAPEMTVGLVTSPVTTTRP